MLRSRLFVENQTTTQPHNHTTTQPHNHTTTQPHNHTTTQPHNHTTTQPHNHTTTQPHNHTTTQPHNHTASQLQQTARSPSYPSNTPVMSVEYHVELLARTLRSANLRSRRYQRNLENTVHRCLNPNQTRRGALYCWSQAYEISLSTFVLVAATFGYDTVVRRRSRILNAISKLKDHRIHAQIQQHPIISELASRLEKQG